MVDKTFDLIVLGAGPGGYVGAIRASQLGMKVAVVEQRATLGGVCLNEGCIPSKALLDSSEHYSLAKNHFAMHGIEITEPKLNLTTMMQRKDNIVSELTSGVEYLFKKNGISWIKGQGILRGTDNDHFQQIEVGPEVYKGKKILLATGSCPVAIPGLPIDNSLIIDSTGALSLAEVPDHLVVVGAGYIGLELGSVWLRLGAKVSVVEMLPEMLPKSDPETVKALQRSLKKQGMNIHLNARIEDIQVDNNQATLTVIRKNKTQEIEADKILISAGRKPNLEGYGLKESGVELDESGFIRVDDNYMTTAPGIYAVGDIIDGPMLAHKASEEAVVCVERMTGQAPAVNYHTIPGVCYTWPEMASIGKTEPELEEEGIPFKVGKFNFMGNGRARAMAETEGLVKILVHPETRKILGFHILGPHASDLIAEVVAVTSLNGTVDDIVRMIHSHPTLSEAIKEASLDVDDSALHA
ncbi:MAG: dihydrolipoyl dehydrogenase [Desulfuromusa sp.]|jgi:dihydrolipoamide dehydrogenase|nr:dihydrolipoyl dehydrogenase [Desulfuromusa sp.]